MTNGQQIVQLSWIVLGFIAGALIAAGFIKMDNQITEMKQQIQQLQRIVFNPTLGLPRTPPLKWGKELW